MTLQEFDDEFRFKYDADSNGGPSLNSYEKSLCLTQAAKDIFEEVYESYETNEKSKRILAPFLTTRDCGILPVTDEYVKFRAYNVSLPSEMHYVLREEVKLKNCTDLPIIENTGLDHLSSFLNNPFKKPNKRKVIKAELSGNAFRIYSQEEVLKYRITFLKKDNPIILINFATDPELIQDETIQGSQMPSTTLLPSIVHDKIIDRAVILAIKTTRENSLQSQVQIK